MTLRAAALALLVTAGCDDDTAATAADLAVADLAGCRSLADGCTPSVCGSYADAIAPVCPSHEAVEAGTCGGYDILVFHNGMTTVTTFYDPATGAFVASLDRHGFCIAPAGFVFPTCDPQNASFLCLDLGSRD